MKQRIFICDKELAQILSCSQSTITRSVHGKGGMYDALRKVNPVIVGGSRRWSVTILASALNVTPDEILACL